VPFSENETLMGSGRAGRWSRLSHESYRGVAIHALCVEVHGELEVHVRDPQ
jgi:hypothetical protein